MRNRKRKTPEEFLGHLGVVPVLDTQIPERLIRLGGAPLLNAYDDALSEAESDPAALVRFFHGTSELLRLGMGLDFARLCRAARGIEALQTSLPDRVLDLGGGSGVLAHWVAHLWPEARAVVADPAPPPEAPFGRDKGGADRVEYLETSWPGLAGIEADGFDLILLSSTIDFLLEGAEWSGPELRKIWIGLEGRLSEGGSILLLDEFERERRKTIERSLAGTALTVTGEMKFEPVTPETDRGKRWFLCVRIGRETRNDEKDGGATGNSRRLRASNGARGGTP